MSGQLGRLAAWNDAGELEAQRPMQILKEYNITYVVEYARCGTYNSAVVISKLYLIIL
jgi:hypothetical protein